MSFFCIGNEPKSGLARDLGDCLQSRNVPFGTSGDLCRYASIWFIAYFQARRALSDVRASYLKLRSHRNENPACLTRSHPVPV